MNIFKELEFKGKCNDFVNFKRYFVDFKSQNWKFIESEFLKDYILFDYIGNELEKAELSIYFSDETIYEGKVKVTNIVPLLKGSLSIDEYNLLLESFFEEVINPNKKNFAEIQIIGPTSCKFDPLNYISEKALNKLRAFCLSANKSTGSSHPCDEERWYDFIFQTIDDDLVFDYDTLYKFLIDEEYWGKKSGIGSIGNFAWSEEMANQLALEYENYVRILKKYKERIGK